MTSLEKRSELIASIQHLSDAELEKLYKMMEKDFPEIISSTRQPKKERFIGSMKGSLVYMSDDFNEPLDDFKDYMPEEHPEG